jgi:F0F1-type ATP synthase delta subunit
MLKNLKVVLCDENIKAIVSNDSFDNKYKVSLLTDVLKRVLMKILQDLYLF